MSALAVLLLALQLGAPGMSRSAPAGQGFPHERHAGLFPLCSGCHAGIETDVTASRYPDPETCRRCHDGTRARLVSWSGGTRAPSNLDFSHRNHAAAAGGTPSCAECHDTGGGGRMSVGAPRPELCLRCHEGGGHLDADTRCRKCHVPLAAVRSWSVARVAALPRPASHATPEFIAQHGAGAAGPSCATCHARESCERCHLNAERLAPVVALARDARVAGLFTGLGPSYPRPSSHAGDWDWSHGTAAGRVAAGCDNCHAQASCRVCHSLPNAAISTLAAPPEADPRGVRFRSTPRVHMDGFAMHHEARGASEASCTGCHDRTACAACHAGSRDPDFHERNFLARHGPESFGSEVQCSSCHSTELFCRSCHEGTGRSAAGRSSVVYHGDTPLWLLGHGQAARQSLESCASCHAQSDCARCHSALGGWGVNPHGSGFSASRLSQKAQLMCLRCHRSASLVAP